MQLQLESTIELEQKHNMLAEDELKKAFIFVVICYVALVAQQVGLYAGSPLPSDRVRVVTQKHDRTGRGFRVS